MLLVIVKLYCPLVVQFDVVAASLPRHLAEKAAAPKGLSMSRHG